MVAWRLFARLIISLSSFYKKVHLCKSKSPGRLWIILANGKLKPAAHAQSVAFKNMSAFSFYLSYLVKADIFELFLSLEMKKAAKPEKHIIPKPNKLHLSG